MMSENNPAGFTYYTSNFFYCATMLFIAKTETVCSYRAHVSYTVSEIV